MVALTDVRSATINYPCISTNALDAVFVLAEDVGSTDFELLRWFLSDTGNTLRPTSNCLRAFSEIVRLRVIIP